MLVEVFIRSLLKRYCLFYPSVHLLSPDNTMESKRKRNSVKMQPRKVKIKASWGPFSQNKFWGPGEVSSASPPTSRWHRPGNEATIQALE